MLRHGLLFLFAAVGAVAGCTGRDGIRDAGDAARSLVRVQVSYTRVEGAPLNEAVFDAQAHFVRYRSFDRAGLPTILGLPDYESIPLESCHASDGVAELDEALAGTSLDGTTRGVPAEVALLDAGRIELRGPVDRAVMRPHHYPELVPFVAGVVYASDETAPVTLALGQPYQVAGDGGDEVGPFLANATAPRAFPALTVEPLRRAGGIAGDLEVRWADAGDAEPILLEIKWASRNGVRAVRCRVRDDGEFSVPHDAFDSLPAQPSAATVSAIRFQRGPLLAPGAGRGDFTLELRDVAPLVVSP